MPEVSEERGGGKTTGAEKLGILMAFLFLGLAMR